MKSDLERILNKYNQKFAENLYDEAEELTSLLSNDELLSLYEQYPQIFQKVVNKTKEQLIKDTNALQGVTCIIDKYIRSRELTPDKFNKMTLDEVYEFIENLIDEKTPLVYNIMKTLETDAGNRSNQNSSRNSK